MNKPIYAKPPIIVQELAKRIGIAPYLLIHDLMDMGHFAASNWPIKPEVASAICEKNGFTLILPDSMTSVRRDFCDPRLGAVRRVRAN